VLVGDFGTRDASERAVAREAKRWTAGRPLDVVVTLGDNVYDSGAPADIAPSWKPYGWVNRRAVPVLAALGNHDVETGDGHPEVKFFDMPGHWYVREVGPVEVVVLDANQPTNPKQRKWLHITLAQATARWTMVVFHQPAYSCGLHGSTPDVQDRWVPLFRRYHVDLVVNGHDHDYQRFAPIKGVTYVVDGGGGGPLYDVGACPGGTPTPVVPNDTDHGFLYLTATTSRLTGKAIASDGTVLDTFVLRNR